MNMKKLILLSFLSLALWAQSTVFYTWNLQVSPADSAVPVNTTLNGAVALANYLFRNTLNQMTLSASCAAAATSCTVSNGGAVVVGNGICFSQPCTLTATATGGTPPTTFTLSSGEVALVTAVSGNTLTLKRNSIGTAAAMVSGQPITVLVAGSYSQQTANLLAAVLDPIIQNCANGAYTAVTQCSAITAAQSALAGVQ